jgi:Uma2 family endonuclease
MGNPVKSGITVEELIQANIHHRAEVINGALTFVDVPEDILHSFLSGNVYSILHPFTDKHQLGDVLTGGLVYLLDSNETGILNARIPDLSFLRKGRLSATIDLSVPFSGSPNLAIEVFSPNESNDEIKGKVRDLLTYGTEEVWVLNPSEKKVYQYRRDNLATVRIYSDDNQLECEKLFPGLVVTVDQFFALAE